jgi:preprotein translocase subunit SecF
MLIGIVVGTYSLFIATPVLVDTISRDKSWLKNNIKKVNIYFT